MGEKTVVVDGLTKDYDDITAVDNISFEVEKGEFFSLLGPSGCGKTTTLRCIAGFERLTAGSILIDGAEMTAVPPYDRDTGMVFQGYALFPHKTVGENVGFGLKMQGVSKDERQERIQDALELVDLPGFEDRSPGELSGGQQQRVALARALIIEPSVLLLDEPLSNLDLKLRKQMRFELKRIQDELNITTIYVTHDQEEALSMSDRVVVMNDGEIEQIGSPLEIYNEPENEFVADFIGETNLIPGRLRSKDKNEVEVSIDSITDKPLSVPRTALTENIRSGNDVMVNIRPEDMQIKHNGGGSTTGTSLTGEVSAQTFLGKDTRLLVDIGGDHELLVETSGQRGQQQFATGDHVAVEWNEDDCLIIPEHE